MSSLYILLVQLIKKIEVISKTFPKLSENTERQLKQVTPA